MIEQEKVQRLQPLRIPAGWKIVFHNFFVLDPLQYAGSDCKFWENFVEDMLYLVYEQPSRTGKRKDTSKIAIDLGWYPEMNANGEFALYVIKDDDWNCPLAEFRSRSQQEIVNTIEIYAKKFSAPCYH